MCHETVRATLIVTINRAEQPQKNVINATTSQLPSRIHLHGFGNS